MSHRNPQSPLTGLILQKYGRFWAVYDQGTLVVVTVYKKGALEVMKRLTTLRSSEIAEEVPDGRS
jgi:hypothetical protein